MPSVTVSTYIPLDDFNEIDRLVKEKKYMNRSDLIRTAVKNELKKHRKEK